MVKKAANKTGKALVRKDMKKTKGGIECWSIQSPAPRTGGTITGNLNGDGRTINNAGFSGSL